MVIWPPVEVVHCTSRDWSVMSTSRLSRPAAAATATTLDSTWGAPAPQRSISSPTRRARSREAPASRSSAAAWSTRGLR